MPYWVPSPGAHGALGTSRRFQLCPMEEVMTSGNPSTKKHRASSLGRSSYIITYIYNNIYIYILSYILSYRICTMCICICLCIMCVYI